MKTEKREQQHELKIKPSPTKQLRNRKKTVVNNNNNNNKICCQDKRNQIKRNEKKNLRPVQFKLIRIKCLCTMLMRVHIYIDVCVCVCVLDWIFRKIGCKSVVSRLFYVWKLYR